MNGLKIDRVKIQAKGEFTPPLALKAKPRGPIKFVSESREVVPQVHQDAKGFLRAEVFGFTLPPAYKITGIRVELWREAAFTEGVVIHDRHLALTVRGRAMGNNFQKPEPWPQGQSTQVYGAETDPLGCHRLTSEGANDSTFGLVFAAVCQAPDELENPVVTARIMRCKITLWAEGDDPIDEGETG